MTKTLHQRMEEKTDKSGVCWIWTACRNRAGYGRIGVHRRSELAHRVAYELSKGPIQNGLIVRHKCDNPPCVNPEHLIVGTHADNVRDMDERGRRVSAPVRGEEHHKAKLTESDVREIFRMRAETKATQQAIADTFGVSQFMISSILRGEAWSHLELAANL